MAAIIVDPVRLRPITADEYHRMGEIGILGPEERVELLNGRIVQMPRTTPRHAYCVTSLTMEFHRVVRDHAVVMIRSPIRLDRLSEPQPDLLLLRAPLERYEDRHPAPDDALLVVQVSDSSLRFDRGEKLRAYARHAIPEYWLVDVPRRRLFVYSQPEGDTYRNRDVLESGASIAPSLFPSITIAVDELLPSRNSGATP